MSGGLGSRATAAAVAKDKKKEEEKRIARIIGREPPVSNDWTIRQFYEDRLEYDKIREQIDVDDGECQTTGHPIKEGNTCCAICESTGKRCLRQRMKDQMWCEVHYGTCSGKIGVRSSIPSDRYNFWNLKLHNDFDELIKESSDIAKKVIDDSGHDDQCIADEVYNYLLKKKYPCPIVKILKIYLAITVINLIREKQQEMCYRSCTQQFQQSKGHEQAINFAAMLSRAFDQGSVKKLHEYYTKDPITLEDLYIMLDTNENFVCYRLSNLTIGEKSVFADELVTIGNMVNELKDYYKGHDTSNTCLTRLQQRQEEKDIRYRGRDYRDEKDRSYRSRGISPSRTTDLPDYSSGYRYGQQSSSQQYPGHFSSSSSAQPYHGQQSSSQQYPGHFSSSSSAHPYHGQQYPSQFSSSSSSQPSYSQQYPSQFSSSSSSSSYNYNRRY